MRNFKNIRRLAAALAVSALLVGCGGSSGSYAADTTGSYEMSNDVAMVQDAAGSTGSSLMTDRVDGTEQKIVYTANLRMESTDFDAAAEGIRKAAADAGAYFENTDAGGSAEDGSRYANYTARVPVDKYSAFLTAVGKAGSVLSQNESADNITASYLDVEARLSALTAQRDRLNELADAAETTADLLEIESQLSDVQYQIESYTSQKRYMDSQVSYSTVEISLDEVRTLTPVNESFGEQLSSAFTGGLDAFISFIKGLVLTLVFLSPLLVVVAAIVAIMLFATRKSRAARKAQAAARKAAYDAARAGAAGAPVPSSAPGAPTAQAKPDAGNNHPIYKQ